MSTKNIGKRIILYRKQNKMTQIELAEKLFVSNKTVSKWESGRAIPCVEDLYKICEIFNITIDELCMNKKRNNTKILCLIIIIILLISTVILMIKLNNIDNYKAIQINGDIFYLENSYYLKNNKMNHLYLGNLKYYGDSIDNINILVLYDGKIVSKTLPYECDEINDISKLEVFIKYSVHNSKQEYRSNISLKKYEKKDLKYITTKIELDKELILSNNFIEKDNKYIKTKKDNNKTIDFIIDTNNYLLEKNIKTEQYTLTYIYDYKNYIFEVIKKYDKENEIKYSYEVLKDKLSCTNNCDNYQKEYDKLKEEFEFLKLD